jgi:hypothetical protein
MIDLREILRRAATSKHISAIWAGTGAFIGGSAAQTMSGGALIKAFSLVAGAALGIAVGKLIDGLVAHDRRDDADMATRLSAPQVLDLAPRQTLEFKDHGPTNR